MFRNYLSAALRNLARNKLYAAINIMGLTIGLAAAILIALFVRYEFSYDQFIPGYERVFRVSEIYNRPGQPAMAVDSTLPNIAAAMKLDYPAIEAIARLQTERRGLHVGSMEGLEDVAWVDPDFFKVMPLPVIAGDPTATLARADGVVLTRSMARKYFGRDDPVGESIEVDRLNRMRVGAVVEDLPSNSHLPSRTLQIFASGLASISPLALAARDAFSGDNVYSYLRLRNSAAAAEIARDLPAFVKRNAIGPQPNVTPPILKLTLVAISDIHLQPAGLGALGSVANKATLLAMLAVGGLILLVAAINYVNLMTARAGKRAVEVGVRKAAGAERRDLVMQFIGESLIYVVIAMLAAIACIELLLPYFNAFAEANIVFDYWRDPALLSAMMALIVATGVLAGSYPAFVLAAFRPLSVLKSGAAQAAGPGVVRRALVILQFAVLIGIIFMTATIYRQTRFALNETLRVPTDEIMLVPEGCGESFKNQVRALPGVRSAACSPFFNLQDTGVRQKDGSWITARQSRVDFDYLELYGMRPLAGRFFSRSFGEDSVNGDAPPSFQPNVVINETALRQLGYSNPSDAIGRTVTWIRGVDLKKAPLPSTIIGVAPDFSFNASRTKIESQIFFVQSLPFGWLHIKLDGAKMPETIAEIERIWKRLGGVRPISRVFLNQLLQRQFRDVIRQGAIFAVFSGLALFLACIGLFALAAFTIERRIKEIGIRKAMGANVSDIVRLFAWEFSRPVLWANLIAWPVAYYLASRWLNGFAYHVDLTLWMFLAAGALALVIALITVSGQAFLAARAKPITALKYE